MLKKAMSSSSSGTIPHHYHHPASNNGSSTSISMIPGGLARSSWKSRLCIGFSIVIFLSIGIIFIAWSMICQIDIGNPALNSDYRIMDSTHRDISSSILNSSSNNSSSSNGAIIQDQPSSRPRPRHVVEIYYEVLCPDSRHFILKQFNPTFSKLKEFIKPVFVPYGKASTVVRSSTSIEFDCQHGEEECLGNTIHACAIKYVTDEDQLVNYIGCMINNNRRSEYIAKKCADDLGINLNPISKCWKSTEGSLLLKRYGEMTHSLSPSVSFIPTIVVDQSQKGQVEILKNFNNFMCTTKIGSSSSSSNNDKPNVCM